MSLDLAPASMITPVVELGTAPIFRKEIELDPGHGAVDLGHRSTSAASASTRRFLNGNPVGDDVLSPGWIVVRVAAALPLVRRHRPARRHHRARRVGRQRVVPRAPRVRGCPRDLRQGARPRSPSSRSTSPTAIARSSATDDSWRAGGGDVLADDLYDGQTIDAGRRSDAWLRPARHEASDRRAAAAPFMPVRPLDFDLATLQPYVGPPATRQDVRRPDARSGPRRRGGRWWTSGRTWSVGSGSRCAARAAARSGSGMRRCSSTRSSAPARCGTPQATDRFILSGGEDFFEPTKTFHGFRYAEVSGVARRAHRGRPRGGRRPLRPGAHRILRVLRAGPQPAAPQRRVGHQGELPRCAHRLPAAQRTARLDR